MRRLAATAGTIIAVIAGASLALPAASIRHGGAKRVPCGPPRAHTLAASPLARVYASAGVVYGCSVRGRRSYPLQDTGKLRPFERVGPVAVAAEVAAYGVATHGVDTVSVEVIVRRLTNGKQLRSEPATFVAPLGVEFLQRVEAVVVKADGAVAWIAGAGHVFSGILDVQVNKADKRGIATLDLGTATAIGERSLPLQGSTVSWLDGGVRRSAALH